MLGMTAVGVALFGCSGRSGGSGPIVDPPPVTSHAAYTVPHWVATPAGTIAAGGFDTSLTFYYAKDLAGFSPGQPFDNAIQPVADGVPVRAHLYLLNAAGAPVTSNNVVACNPCTYELAAGAARKVVVSVSQLLAAAGFNSTVVTGVAVIGIENAADGEVLIRSTIVHRPSPSINYEFVSIEPQLLSAAF